MQQEASGPTQLLPESLLAPEIRFWSGVYVNWRWSWDAGLISRAGLLGVGEEIRAEVPVWLIRVAGTCHECVLVVQLARRGQTPAIAQTAVDSMGALRACRARLALRYLQDEGFNWQGLGIWCDQVRKTRATGKPGYQPLCLPSLHTQMPGFCLGPTTPTQPKGLVLMPAKFKVSLPALRFLSDLGLFESPRKIGRGRQVETDKTAKSDIRLENLFLTDLR